MTDILPNPALLPFLQGKTALITGAANGIGAATARLFYTHGANLIIADLEASRPAAEALIATFETELLAKPNASSPSSSAAVPPVPPGAVGAERGVAGERARFLPADVTDWASLQGAFKEAVRVFGRVDVVVANAGIMETSRLWDFEGPEGVDENGDLRAPEQGWRVLDVNLKGGLNTLRLAMFYMRNNTPSSTGTRGSIVIVSSTSGYFGGTGVVSYIASKHGLMGLLRSSQAAAVQYGVRLNAIVPFVTPTHITGNYYEKWKAAGLPSNEPEDVASTIAMTAVDESLTGNGILIAAKKMRELEGFYAGTVPEWLGPEHTVLMQKANAFFQELGGYPLPQARGP